ncbi:Phosphoglucomutase, first 3 domain-containing protein [Schizophyllum commune Tattone D]|nr:Phosphoglucomutase, first 3 domain-containing protein [Schizophyllum commune Tattone D]
MASERLELLVKEWLRIDRNEATRKEIEQLWASKDLAALETRLGSRIEFGTAGLRGRMEAGWSRMNDVTVIQASQGLCAYVLANVPNAAERGVVVGHDHRHNSERWAKLTAAAFIEKGVKVYLHRGLVHTPLVPFTVKNRGAACGVMITASHNPKQDNGYKVYWENAVQIIAPHDTGISASIEQHLEPTTWSVDGLASSALCVDVTQQMKDAYFESLLNIVQPAIDPPPVKFVNTSMHGVSHPFVTRAFEILNFPPFTPVAEQQNPDPEFPTVRYPNPEEKGALDLAMKTAAEQGAQIILAQDPDSDRFSAIEAKAGGGWTTFTGDQLGVIFAASVFEKYKATGKPLDKLVMVASTVSSKMVAAMAAKERFKFTETLTGFKFIGNAALDLAKQGYEVPFGYEEAIGYMFGETRDKDGVAATISFVDLVLSLYRRGKTVKGYLDELYERYGYFETRNSYFICGDPKVITKIFSGLRNTNSDKDVLRRYPHTLGGLNVTAVSDLTVYWDSRRGTPRLPRSSGQMIQFWAAGEGVNTASEGVKITLTLRTSGTEPKIKYYLEGSGTDRAAVSETLGRVVEDMRVNWMQAEQFGLLQP